MYKILSTKSFRAIEIQRDMGSIYYTCANYIDHELTHSTAVMRQAAHSCLTAIKNYVVRFLAETYRGDNGNACDGIHEQATSNQVAAV